MIVGVLITCHTQYTSDSSICIFLFNRSTLQIFVTYITAVLQSDTKKRELLKNPTKIEEIQDKKIY